MTGARRQKLDVLLAFKAIALTDELTGTEKRVAAAIVDSFNHRTTQCDPSLNRIAHLLGMSRRTVIRAVIRLERLRLVRKDRHGGHSLRNSYEPHWIRYREIEAAWATHKRTRHWNARATEMSPCRSQTSHLDGGADGTQTFLINQSNKPEVTSANFEGNHSRKESKSGGRLESKPERIREGARRLHASRVVAERRWSADLHRQFASDLEAYAALIGAIDANIQAAATEAELREHGAGLALILQQVRVRLKAESEAKRPDVSKEAQRDRPAANESSPPEQDGAATNDKVGSQAQGGRGFNFGADGGP